MGMHQSNRIRLYAGICTVAVALYGCAGSEPESAVEEAPPVAASESPPFLPQVTDLPSSYRSVGELASRGEFYAAGEEPAFRTDDGNHYHGYDGPLVWAEESKRSRPQGVLYGVEDGAIVSAGYLIRPAELVASNSYHGLSLRELDFPAAHSMTVDFIEGETAESNQYLWLWHFRPEGDEKPMLPLGQLPSLSILPGGYEVFACDHLPETRFCPGMGRHYVDLPDPVVDRSLSRRPDSTGDYGVIYGEAAEKLIFIEYVFRQEDLAAGISWPAIPLDRYPIPPIDNIHILHFGDAESAAGRYTVHMYFLPEETYLAWEAEPDRL